MKRVRSIFGIFTVFLLIILASFLLLSWQSTANLKASLIQTAQLQTKYAATLLEQKGKEIEIEADGILYGENMQNLYAAIENNDVYEYVQQINKMKSFFQARQGRTVGMSGMRCTGRNPGGRSARCGRDILRILSGKTIRKVSGNQPINRKFFICEDELWNGWEKIRRSGWCSEWIRIFCMKSRRWLREWTREAVF